MGLAANWFFSLFHLNVLILAVLVSLSAPERPLKWIGWAISLLTLLVVLGPFWPPPGGSDTLLLIKVGMLIGSLLMLVSRRSDTRLIALLLVALAGITLGFQVWSG